MEAAAHTPQRPGRRTRPWLMMLAGLCLLSVGGWVYVSSRPGTLIYSLCHDALGLPGCAWLSDFARYSLPNGLWSLASVLMLHPFLAGEPRRRRLGVVSVVPALGVASELMQAPGWLPGVFDPLDLLCYSLPILIYYLISTTIPAKSSES